MRRMIEVGCLTSTKKEAAYDGKTSMSLRMPLSRDSSCSKPC
jgi:hypothetical protein